MLQRAAGPWGQPGAQHPADRGAANKAEEPHAPVSHQLSTDGRIFGDQSLTPLLGQPAFAQEATKR